MMPGLSLFAQGRERAGSRKNSNNAEWLSAAIPITQHNEVKDDQLPSRQNPGATCLFTVNLARRDITLLVATCSSTSITSISVRSSTGTSPVPSTDLGQRSIAIPSTEEQPTDL